MSEINERIAALEAQLAVLKAEVGGAPDEEQSQTRRDVFKKFAIGAAGVAAGGALLAKATPAAANNLDNIKIGTQGGANNLGTLATRVDYTGPATEGTGFVFHELNINIPKNLVEFIFLCRNRKSLAFFAFA